jgi:hypothetical protein
MPYFDGTAGKTYFKAWRAVQPRLAAVVFLHGFGEHCGLYHRLGNALAVAPKSPRRKRAPASTTPRTCTGAITSTSAASAAERALALM